MHMDVQFNRGTMLTIPLIQERYALPFATSLAIHLAVASLAIWGGYLLPMAAIGVGASGGGLGGSAYTVGVVDELGGGAGMVKPAVVPRPPALMDENPVKVDSKAVSIPNTLEVRKKKISARELKEAEKLKLSKSNVVPTTTTHCSGTRSWGRWRGSLRYRSRFGRGKRRIYWSGIGSLRRVMVCASCRNTYQLQLDPASRRCESRGDLQFLRSSRRNYFRNQV